MKKINEYLSKNHLLYNNHLANDHKLNNLIQKAIQDKLLPQKEDQIFPFYWDAKRFGFQNTNLFTNFSVSEQNNVLSFLSKMNINMSYFIEKCAYNYGAKMILLSETEEEKIYYSIFTYEEALHQKEFDKFISNKPTPSTAIHPLLNPLTRCIEQAEKDASVFVVQVLLEGYGMYIYKSLGETTISNDLQNVYKKIVQEEAGHHGSGLLIAEKDSIDETAQAEIIDYTWEFSEAIQNPCMIRQALESVDGKMSNTQFKNILDSMSYAANAQQRLDLLKNLLKRFDHWNIFQKLENKNAFTYKEML
jgi:hypothetical protein